MSVRDDFRRAVPWALCATALGMLGLGTLLRWLARDQNAGADVDWLTGFIRALGFAGIPVVGAMMASRRPANPYGWLWCALGLAYGLANVARPLVRAVGGPLWVAWTLETWGKAAFLGLLVFVFLLFPTGRLPTPRWRWVARAAGTGAVLLMLLVPFISDPDEPTAAGPWTLTGESGRWIGLLGDLAPPTVFGFVLVGMFSLGMRFRRAGAVERRQLAWFLYATVVNAVVFVVDGLGNKDQTLVSTAIDAVAFTLLPVAVGVAVLRYRLYEIDRIVSRTVSYGLLTAGLIGVYLLVVGLLRPLLEPFTGSSTLAVAGSTLAVAAVFNPARRRLQDAVDRRFDRARYDAALAVEAFAAQLRTQVDLDQITEGLCATVTDTVAPGRMGVWIRTPERTAGAAP